MRVNTMTQSLVILCGSLIAVVNATADEISQTWNSIRTMSATEASQAAAVDDKFVYGIGNTVVAKYDRKSGEGIAVSSGDATHLNSGFAWDGKLYCAHSNYPTNPERSEIKQLDPDSMRLTTFKEFGDFGGSLTWCVRQDDSWWCNFAKYGDQNGSTFLVKFDADWREQSRWSYPAEVIRQLGRYSLSGGVWRGRLLLVTGHDDPVLFRLRLPEHGNVLEFVDQQAAPFTGQGIATDPQSANLVGINRPKKQIIFARAEASLPQPRLPREQLLVYRGPNNEATPVKNRDDWQQRRDDIRRNMQLVMGPLPGLEKRCDLDVRVQEEVDLGSYVRRLITYQ